MTNQKIRIHSLEHVSFEGLGYIQTWAAKKGYVISTTKFYEESILPDIDEFDLLIVMGGPMSIADESGYPWLTAEKDFISRNGFPHITQFSI